MKRLMIIALMFISFLVQADDANAPSNNATDSQSSSDSTKSDDVSVSIANVHHINLDTTQVDGGGNWLHKRLWYERAQNVFGEIRALVSSVGDVRMQFSNEVNAVGHKIDTFFETVDFTKGELDDKFKEILVALDTEQKIVGDLSAQERTLQTTIKQEIKVIEQVGKNIKSIGEVDNKIDETLMQAFKTIDECRDYETKAWESFQSIGKELDDKKARNLYYQMNNYKQNIDQKITYLKNTLLPYLHNVLVAKIDMNISKINQSMNDLKTKGIDLQKIMSKTQEDDILALHEREKAATQVAVRKAVEAEEKKSQEIAEKLEQKIKEAEKKSFTNVVNEYYGSTLGKFADFFHTGYLGASIDYVGSFFTGFFKSYSYPVITYVYHSVLAAQAYMKNLVVRLMMHYGGKQAVQAVVAEKIEKKIEQIQESGHTVKEVVQEKIAEKIAEKMHEAQADNVQAVQPAPAHVEEQSNQAQSQGSESSQPVQPVEPSTMTPEQTSSEQSVQVPSATEQPAPSQPADNATTTSTTAQPIESAQAAVVEVKPAEQVVVQSLQQDTAAQQQEKTSGLYQIFKAFLDFIGTMLMSVYRCIAQFFNLLWKCATYITFTN
jgi:hypothetical protein